MYRDKQNFCETDIQHACLRLLHNARLPPCARREQGCTARDEIVCMIPGCIEDHRNSTVDIDHITPHQDKQEVPQANKAHFLSWCKPSWTSVELRRTMEGTTSVFEQALTCGKVFQPLCHSCHKKKTLAGKERTGRPSAGID